MRVIEMLFPDVFMLTEANKKGDHSVLFAGDGVAYEIPFTKETTGSMSSAPSDKMPTQEPNPKIFLLVL